MRLNLTLRNNGLVLVFVPLAVELFFVGVLVILALQLETKLQRETQVETIIADSNKLTINAYDVGRAIGLEAFRKKDNDQSERLIDDLSAQIDRVENDVRALDPNDKSFEDVEKKARAGLLAFRALEAKGSIGIRRIFDVESDRMLRSYFRAMTEFVKAKTEFSSQVAEETAKTRTLVMIWVLAGVSVNIGLGIALANLFHVGTTKRLDILLDNSLRIAAQKPLNQPIGGGDEIAHLDRVFHAMAKALEDAALRKQEMVAMVSHDLRTPLMSMEASLELLSEGVLGDLPEKAVAELKIAEYSAARLIQLINDLLDIDKLEAGKFDLHRRDVDIGWIFERCIRSVKAFADRHEVKILVPDDDDDAKAYCDPDRIAQVLTNLLSNAIKFSEPGGEVALAYQDLPNATLIKVIDHGRGIPAGFEDRIFERFQQVDANNPQERKGSGLGLAICKAMIDAHNGSIGVDSRVGHGSTFWFRIPKSTQGFTRQTTQTQETK